MDRQTFRTRVQGVLSTMKLEMCGCRRDRDSLISLDAKPYYRRSREIALKKQLEQEIIVVNIAEGEIVTVRREVSCHAKSYCLRINHEALSAIHLKLLMLVILFFLFILSNNAFLFTFS